MSLLSADYIYTPEGLKTGWVLEIDAYGVIRQLRSKHAGEQSIHYSGLLCPGWVNTHCHLELSYLANKIPEGTGMTGFIRALFPLRPQTPEAEKIATAERALEQLWQSGTVAVGDICNTAITAAPKRNFSRLFTHSYIELLGLDKEEANERWKQGLTLAKSFAGLPHSLTAHAPYSTSSRLLERIYQSQPERISVHLLESQAERELFENGTGDFVAFYSDLHLPYTPFDQPSALRHALTHLDPDQASLWVHLTEIKEAELHTLLQHQANAHFCLCPRSNFFLHRRQPSFDVFEAFADRVCLGTDSLASNHSIDLFEELKWLQHTQAQIPLHQLVQWATTQGAAALGQSGNLGIFVPGSRPGINHIFPLQRPEPGLLPSSQLRKLY